MARVRRTVRPFIEGEKGSVKPHLTVIDFDLHDLRKMLRLLRRAVKVGETLEATLKKRQKEVLAGIEVLRGVDTDGGS